MFSKIKGLFKTNNKEMLELDIDEITNYIENNMKKDIENSRGLIANLHDEILNDFSEMKIIVDDLKNNSSEDVFANSMKNKFCERCVEIIESVKKNDIQDAESFLETVKNAISSIGNISVKELRHLHAFKDDMNKIAISTREITEKINKFDFNKTKILSKIDAVKSVIKLIKYKKLEFENLKKNIGENRIKMEEKQKQISEKKDEIMKFLDNDDFRKRDEIMNDMKKTEKDMEAIRQKITTDLSISRILKKFRYSNEDEMSKEERDIIDKYIENPLDAFFRDENMDIKLIIVKILNTIDSGEKEHEKISELFRNIELMKDVRENYMTIKNNLNAKKQQMNDFNYLDKKESLLKKELNGLENMLHELKKTTESKETEKQSLGIINEKNRLETMLTEMLKRHVSVKT